MCVSGLCVCVFISAQTEEQLISSDRIVRLQIDRVLFRNVSNLHLVERNLIRNLTYASVKLLFANFLDVQHVAYTHLPFDVTSHCRETSITCCQSVFIACNW